MPMQNVIVIGLPTIRYPLKPEHVEKPSPIRVKKCSMSEV